MAQDKRGDATQANTSVVPTAPPRWQDSVQLRRFGLEVVDGPDKGATVTAEGERCTVGSHPSNDLVLKGDPTVSRFHCELRSTEEGVRIQDMGSSNGTVVDGLRVEDAWLRDGSQIVIGSSSLLFRIGSESVRIDMSGTDGFGELVGRSLPMRRVFGMLSRCAKSEVTVLIEGETGTGKEGAAAAIHTASTRADGPFVVVDCAAIPENLIESELFGHERGAFTGAVSTRKGAFEEAHGGTIFLDEIGELPTDLQPKLLRVLEQRTIRRVGSTQRIPVDVRVVAATNRDLRAEVNDGHFRSDLYYRLAVIRVTLPPLRARGDDFEVLVPTILERLGAGPEEIERFTAKPFLRRLRYGSWPGNIRELRNYLERCLVLDTEMPLHADFAAKEEQPLAVVDASIPYQDARKRAIADFERRYLEALLEQHDQISSAAEAAGLHRVYVHRLLRRHGIKRGD
ncbi:MAG TPA: sigma 54-interacting transcriptional regulator [Polyangiaceae bacterium LLY-WYZ-15_(1-7)]|nr:AAA family ATPase [Myxococcales bacterium]MAT25928.1 AAA family ATPase [Sandaracinus sp.]HJL02267.1 sigma 54-interacting transcriptional regulator [Polyangiaceae bacterium LLY-WYZ-15_(1-7)]MBJ71319.1 AAA family ATPase [Sandaracinus sp.]HJL09297.1 sigma 54-interacting transcriptional regulator [Polyangiaceae bacterium LLY-WYZ-15_(1-7)]